MTDERPDNAFRLPPTVSRSDLLDAGSDARFRQMVYDLFTVTARMDAVRAELAKHIGVTGPQYSVLMAIAQLQGDEGVPVRMVADQLHVTGAFVTGEAGKLVRRGLVEKRPNPEDGRSVLLRLSPAGRSAMDALAPRVRAVNDRFFGALDRADFANLTRLASTLVRGSGEVVAVAALSEPPSAAGQATRPGRASGPA